MGKLGINGSRWKHVLFFDPEVDNSKWSTFTISAQELRTKLESLVDTEEMITEVTAYKEKMIRVPLTDIFVYHMFIIFKTKSWFWSIEKNTLGIAIQRSKSLCAVRDTFRRYKGKSGIQCLEKDMAGNVNVGDLINWLLQEGELNNKYVFAGSNCHHFGRKVYDFISRHKRFDLSESSTVIKVREQTFWTVMFLEELSLIFSANNFFW